MEQTYLVFIRVGQDKADVGLNCRKDEVEVKHQDW